MNELLHDSSQSRLRIVRHGVSLVQNDDSEVRLRGCQVRVRRSDGQLCERLYLLSDSANTSLVRSVELLHAAPPAASEVLLHQRQSHGRLTSARRSVEQQVWQLACLQTTPQGRANFLLLGNLIDRRRTVFLDPRNLISSRRHVWKYTKLL